MDEKLIPAFRKFQGWVSRDLQQLQKNYRTLFREIDSKGSETSFLVTLKLNSTKIADDLKVFYDQKEKEFVCIWENNEIKTNDFEKIHQEVIKFIDFVLKKDKCS